MSSRTTPRRAARLAPHKARALDALLSSRIAFEIISRVPGLPETREEVQSTRRLKSAIRAATARIILCALRSGADVSGTTVTLIARVPYTTPAGGRSHEPYHLSQLLYSAGRWWQSVDGQRWEPIPGSETPAPLAPALALVEGAA